jgi:hypothetical protein
MDDPATMSMVEGVGESGRQAAGLLRCQRPLLQALGQGRALNVLQDEMRARAVLFHFEQAHDGGVIEAGQGLGLDAEPVERAAGSRRLDGHEATEPAVVGQPHLGLAAPAEPAQQKQVGRKDRATSSPGRGSYQPARLSVDRKEPGHEPEEHTEE